MDDLTLLRNVCKVFGMVGSLIIDECGDLCLNDNEGNVMVYINNHNTLVFVVFIGTHIPSITEYRPGEGSFYLDEEKAYWLDVTELKFFDNSKKLSSLTCQVDWNEYNKFLKED